MGISRDLSRKAVFILCMLFFFSSTSYSAETVVFGLGNLFTRWMHSFRNPHPQKKNHATLRHTAGFVFGLTVPFILKEGEHIIETHDVSPKKAFLGGTFLALVLLGITSLIPAKGMFIIGALVTSSIMYRKTIRFKRMGWFFSRIRKKFRNKESALENQKS